MSLTHLHLLVNHLPILGSLLGGFVLAYGLYTKSIHTHQAAYFILLIAALGASVAYLTGDAAANTVKNILGIAKQMIEQHEDFALVAMVSQIVLGVASVAGLVIAIRKTTLTQSVGFVVLLATFISFGLVAWAGYLGGKIRHTELNTGYTVIFFGEAGMKSAVFSSNEDSFNYR